MKPIFLTEIIVTAILVGLIWMVQILIYPGFKYIDPAQYVEFHNAHINRITPIVGPLMVLELYIGVQQFVQNPIGWNRFSLSVFLLFIIWIATAFLSVPIHNKLILGKDLVLIHKLVNSNWIRTSAWTLKLFVLLFSNVTVYK